MKMWMVKKGRQGETLTPQHIESVEEVEVLKRHRCSVVLVKQPLMRYQLDTLFHTFFETEKEALDYALDIQTSRVDYLTQLKKEAVRTHNDLHFRRILQIGVKA
jgi:hypothetical protein